MLINAGTVSIPKFVVYRLRNCTLFFGSSANISLTGTKFRVEDIDKEIIDIADIVIDHGFAKISFLPAVFDLIEC